MDSIRSAIANTYPELDAVYGQYYDHTISDDQILDALIAKAKTLPDGEGSLLDLKRLMRVNSGSNIYGMTSSAMRSITAMIRCRSRASPWSDRPTSRISWSTRISS
jgi:hypothetical protein